MQMLWGVGHSRFLLKLGNTVRNYNSYLVLSQDRKQNHPRENITFDTIIGGMRQCSVPSPQRDETPTPTRGALQGHILPGQVSPLTLFVNWRFFLLEISLHNVCSSTDTLGSPLLKCTLSGDSIHEWYVFPWTEPSASVTEQFHL